MTAALKYLFVSNITCPDDAFCRFYTNITDCNTALEKAGCRVLNPCILTKKCFEVASTLIEYNPTEISERTGQTIKGPLRAMSVIHYLPLSERLNTSLTNLIDCLPEAVAGLYRAHSQVVNIAAVALLTLGIGYAWGKLSAKE